MGKKQKITIIEKGDITAVTRWFNRNVSDKDKEKCEESDN